MHQIQNDYLRIRAREYGAELISIYYKPNETEHLWQADPAFWGWHAPMLFPVVGRCLNDEITVDGKIYPMEKHGFARKSNFKLLELGDSRMVFELKHSEETLKHYPYKFELLVGYHLHGNKLHCTYEVINIDDKPIYFCIGGHPAFAVPFSAGEKYEDYYIEFENDNHLQRHHINTEGFFTGETTDVLKGNNQLLLKPDMFNDDALIFKNLKSRSVTIKSDLHSQQLKMSFTYFNYLGLWAKPNAPYVCIEPWLGCADTKGKPTDFTKKEGIITLPVGERFNAGWDVEIFELNA